MVVLNTFRVWRTCAAFVFVTTGAKPFSNGLFTTAAGFSKGVFVPKLRGTFFAVNPVVVVAHYAFTFGVMFFTTAAIWGLSTPFFIMNRSVFTMGQQLKIFYSVVSFVVVQMMNCFMRFKVSTQVRFHDEPMFVDSVTFRPVRVIWGTHGDISVDFNSAPSPITTFATGSGFRAVRVGAVDFFTPFNTVGGNVNRFKAIVAYSVGLFHNIYGSLTNMFSQFCN